MSGVHGVGELALRLVVAAPRVAPGLSLKKLPMEAQNALEKQQLHNPATLNPAQVHDFIYFVSKFIDTTFL